MCQEFKYLRCVLNKSGIVGVECCSKVANVREVVVPIGSDECYEFVT